MTELKGTDPAPAGQIYVCGACGKTSRTRYGFDGAGERCASRGWDESCMMNAVLCHDGGPPWRAIAEATDGESVFYMGERVPRCGVFYMGQERCKLHAGHDGDHSA